MRKPILLLAVITMLMATLSAFVEHRENKAGEMVTPTGTKCRTCTAYGVSQQEFVPHFNPRRK